MSDGNKPDSILVFGGNGQMGAPAVALLCARVRATRRHDESVCRGNWYWDHAPRTVETHVRHVVGDRATLATCDEFRRLVDETGKFNLVCGLSAYLTGVTSRASGEILKGHVGVYIVISSDSVYEVSVPKSHEGPSVETDAVRPQDPAEQQRLKVADSYGHYKFACEEVLAEQKNKDGGFPYVALRPPDVIGELI
ncbi:PREDICTED: uncharacterized protein LOC106815830 [Priapulus caudatus]|uniref:Uncharacterized protein LOC106815830 n=1 Tax=Priapulus caudatus TaxID=37621 RepID=A0ABM1EUG3_PRICU|nr:PREDICTED: uncharacterized protein LOC106815830 [Priapulus caudatus]